MVDPSNGNERYAVVNQPYTINPTTGAKVFLQNTALTGDMRFIEEIWKSGAVEKKWGFKPTPDNTDVFLCGNPKMVDSMKALLYEDDFRDHKKKEPGQIHAEEFF